MSYQEKKNILSIISNILITGGYFGYVVFSMPEQIMNTDELLNFWATRLMIYIAVSIVIHIIIHIIFAIINKVATGEDPVNEKDERDKLIELKATRNSQYLFIAGFMIAMASLAMGMSVTVMFSILICSGLFSGIVDNLSQLYFYRRGI